MSTKDEYDENIKKYQNIEKNIDRRIRTKVAPDSISKFFNALNPQTPLGSKASRDFEEHSLTISMVLVFTLIIGTISIIMYDRITNDNSGSVSDKEEDMVLAIMVLSIFTFANFLFLVFDGIRLLNILLFITILSLAIAVVSNIDKNTVSADLGIAIICFTIIPLIVLAYFFMFNDTESITELKTLERERVRRAKFEELVKNKCAVQVKAAKAEVEKNFYEDKGFRAQIGNKVLDQIIKEGRFPTGGKTKQNKESKESKEKKSKKQKKALIDLVTPDDDDDDDE